MGISHVVLFHCAGRRHQSRMMGDHVTGSGRYMVCTEERMVDLKQTLGRFLSIPGVRLAVLVGRDGLLIEGLARDSKEDMEAVGAMMTSSFNSAEALGQEIGRGNVVGVLHEYENGLVSVDPLGD